MMKFKKPLCEGPQRQVDAVKWQCSQTYRNLPIHNQEAERLHDPTCLCINSFRNFS